jgi:oligosaccharide repeat unit polymerase
MAATTGTALALSVGLVGWAALMRALTGTWLQPGAFFALWWCVAGILPLVFAPQERVGGNAMLWLIAASIAVSTGAVVGNSGFKTRISPAQSVPTDRELAILRWALAAAILLGIGSNIAFIIGSGIPIREIFNLEQLVVVSNQLYVSRYLETGAPTPPLLSQALLPFGYLAPALGGVLFVLTREKRWRAMSLVSFLPALAITVLQTTKAAVLFSLILWLSGYFATRLRFGNLRVFTKRHITVGLIVLTTVTLFFSAVSLARLASTDVSLMNVVAVKLLVAAFGHMSVFSQWLAEYMIQPFSPSFGKVTFAGPLEMLGFGQRIPGLFDSIVDLVAGETSNIYTAFRPLIQDFTIPGALVVLGGLGFVGGVGFRMVAAGKWSGVPLLVAAYVTIFWTPVTWFWIYNSLTATVLGLAILVWFIRMLRGATTARARERSIATA